MNKVDTRTGRIFYDRDEQWECLWVGDYGKESNIKADFLGLTKEVQGVEHKEVNLHDKLVITLSTQKGCPMSCTFCDVPKLKFLGNLSYDMLVKQFQVALFDAIKSHGLSYTNRLIVHYARMGEPTYNMDVLKHANLLHKYTSGLLMTARVIHPVVSTMLPKDNKNLVKFLTEWCEIKKFTYNGEAGLQFSINSTDDEQRDKMFNGKSLNLQEISDIAKDLPEPRGRKYILNFAVTKDTILDAEVLSRLFSKDKFIVKLTPIHETNSAVEHDFDISGYEDYDVYRKFEQPLVKAGWDVIVFVPSVEEDRSRVTCGNAILSDFV